MLHHAGLYPADIYDSVRFYRDGVGLDVLAEFTLDGDFGALLGRSTEHVRSVFLGWRGSPQGGLVELLEMGAPDVRGEPPAPGVPHRGLFLLSFHVVVEDVLARLTALGLGGAPRAMRDRRGAVVAATVVDPDGVTVELLSRPVSQLPAEDRAMATDSTA